MAPERYRSVEFARQVVESGVAVTGIYPNILTVLPGTVLARSLEGAGQALDFYMPPRQAGFDEFEDGGMGVTADQVLLEKFGVTQAARSLQRQGRAS